MDDAKEVIGPWPSFFRFFLIFFLIFFFYAKRFRTKNVYLQRNCLKKALSSHLYPIKMRQIDHIALTPSRSYRNFEHMLRDNKRFETLYNRDIGNPLHYRQLFLYADA